MSSHGRVRAKKGDRCTPKGLHVTCDAFEQQLHLVKVAGARDARGSEGHLQLCTIPSLDFTLAYRFGGGLAATGFAIQVASIPWVGQLHELRPLRRCHVGAGAKKAVLCWQ